MRQQDAPVLSIPGITPFRNRQSSGFPMGDGYRDKTDKGELFYATLKAIVNNLIFCEGPKIFRYQASVFPVSSILSPLLKVDPISIYRNTKVTIKN